jgi:hypothetical protein
MERHQQLICELEQELFGLILQGREIKQAKKRIREQLAGLEAETNLREEEEEEEENSQEVKRVTRSKRQSNQCGHCDTCPCGNRLHPEPVLEIGVCFGKECLRKNGKPRRFSVPLNYYSCSSDFCSITICQTCFKNC